MNYVEKNRVLFFNNMPKIISVASCVGKEESIGPLGDNFDITFQDDGVGQPSWEKAESELVKCAIEEALKKKKMTLNDIDVVFAGDLLNQCTASNYALRNSETSFAGLFGACSTMALSLIMASAFVDAKYVDRTIAATSSHFCSAEKQFRYPLEYGGQRAPSCQRTVTGAGAFILGNDNDSNVYVSRALLGKIVDYGITDTSNMGAAMAPAAAKTIAEFLKLTDESPDEFDLIITGDLGKIGSNLLKNLLFEDYGINIRDKHEDCGLMIYNMNTQDVHSGGSGCGCSAVVMASLIYEKLVNREVKKVLFAGTGALMSPLVSLQGESIPAVCHIVELRS